MTDLMKRVDDVVSRIKIREHSIFKLSFSVMLDERHDAIQIVIALSAPDINTGRAPAMVYQFCNFTASRLLSIPPDQFDRYVLYVVNRNVRALIVHELDEAFFVDDKHYRDPHPDDSMTQRSRDAGVIP